MTTSLTIIRRQDRRRRDFPRLAFAILRPGSDAVKSRRHIRALRRDFVDQFSRHPSHSESEFESLTYHHVVSSAHDELARRWLLRWGVYR